MQQRISLITLGVADLARARAFYDALGWQASAASQDGIAFYQLNGLALALYSRKALAEDALVDDSTPGFSGITLAHNCRSEAEVDSVFAGLVAAGGKALKTPQKVFWGGYSSYISDPDGHLWEIAFNPYFPLDENGNLMLSA